MVKLLFFASLRETLGVSAEAWPLPGDMVEVASLRAFLAERGSPWTVLLDDKNIRVAVNQVMAGADSPIVDGDEVAFFPPVTGG